VPNLRSKMYRGHTELGDAALGGGDGTRRIKSQKSKMVPSPCVGLRNAMRRLSNHEGAIYCFPQQATATRILAVMSPHVGTRQAA
jgi:hypothetical protein